LGELTANRPLKKFIQHDGAYIRTTVSVSKRYLEFGVRTTGPGELSRPRGKTPARKVMLTQQDTVQTKSLAIPAVPPRSLQHNSHVTCNRSAVHHKEQRLNQVPHNAQQDLDTMRKKTDLLMLFNWLQRQTRASFAYVLLTCNIEIRKRRVFWKFIVLEGTLRKQKG
jgi:hypothetical protein